MNGRKEPADEAVTADLRALRAETARHLPHLDDTVRRATSPRDNRERIMNRPWFRTLAGATGVAGTITYASGFVYVCVATNTWQRAAIATW